MHNDKNYEKITERIDSRFVMATLDQPTQYLISEHFGKWSFTDNIAMATKVKTRDLAETLVGYFNNDVKLDVDVVILPISIEYNIIEFIEGE